MNYNMEFGIGNSDRGHNYEDYTRKEHLPYTDDYARPRQQSDDRYNNRFQRHVSPVNKRVYDDYVTRDYEDRDNEPYTYSDSNSYNSNTRDNYENNGRSNRRRNDREQYSSRSRSRSRDRDSRPGRDRNRYRDDSRDSRRESRRESPRSRRDNSRNRDDDYRKRDISRERYGREDYRDRDDYRGRRSRDDTSWRDDRSEWVPPSSTVIVQNLVLDAAEKDIEDLLKRDGVRARTVSVIRERNGESRGFAFVDFDDVETAEKWLKVTKKSITINGHTSSLNFSKSKKTPEVQADWICKTCNVLNFGSRVRQGDKRCFKCKAIQSDISSNDLETSRYNDSANDVIKVEPCNVLMLRGMDFSTSEETIRMEIVKLTSKPIYDVRLIKDKVTDMSRGFAFVEMGNVEDSKELLETIERSNPPFEIAHRRITVGYARHGYNAPLNGKKNVQYNQVSKQTVAENAVAQASAAKATLEYSQSMADSYALAGSSNQQGNNSTDQQHSNYTYDAKSGYYYDVSSGLYYDPNTGYYYNGTTQQWLYWTGTKYEAVNQDGTPAEKTSTSKTQPATAPEKKPDNETVPITGQKPKNARKIAKDMERWAKKLNNQSEARKVAVKQAQEELRMLEQKEEELRKKISHEKVITGHLSQQINAGKDGLRSLFVSEYEEEGSVLQLGSALTPNKTKKPRGTSLVTDLPDDDDDFVDESKFIDTVKLACMLCQRQFPSKENLMKHVQMSNLHKENLEKYKKSKTS